MGWDIDADQGNIRAAQANHESHAIRSPARLFYKVREDIRSGVMIALDYHGYDDPKYDRDLIKDQDFAERW